MTAKRPRCPVTYTLHHGDCLEVMAGMEAGSVDAVVTDPPYCSGGYFEAHKNTKAQGLRGSTVGRPNFNWFVGDNMGTAGLVWLLREVAVQLVRVLRPDSPAFVFTDWRMVPSLAPAIESAGFRYRNMIVWDKGCGGLGNGFKPAHEIVMEFAKGRTTYNVMDGSNVIREKRVSAPRKQHPAEKPTCLIRELVRVAVRDGGTILDPFTGSGTTGVACVEEGRDFIGIEREAEYVEIARRRIDAAAAQLRMDVEA